MNRSLRHVPRRARSRRDVIAIDDRPLEPNVLQRRDRRRSIGRRLALVRASDLRMEVLDDFSARLELSAKGWW